MFRWLSKRYRQHVCEFSPWLTCEMVFRRPATPEELAATGRDTFALLVRWQRRECTACGKEEVREPRD